MCLSEMEEHVKKMYYKNNLNAKINYLTEYYKFHKEVPRCFINPVCKNLNCKKIMIDYHDKIRKIEYYKIKRMLHEKKGTDSPFEITKDSQPQANSTSNQSSVDA